MIKVRSDNKKLTKAIGLTVIYIIMAMLAFLMIFPYLWMFLTSFKTNIELTNSLEFKFFPKKFVFDGYYMLLRGATKIPMIRGVLRTMLVEAAVIPIGTVVSALAAFSFAKLRLPFKTGFLLILMSGTMIPYAALMLPQFRIYQSLNMTNTLWPLIIPGWFGNVVMMFFFVQYMKGVPTALIEAAKIDGSGYLQIFFTIIMPLIWPALAVQIIFWFTGIWNDYFAPSIYLTDLYKMTLQPMINIINGDSAGSGRLNAVMAGSTLASIPIIVLYISFQKMFVESVAISGVKG